MICCGRHGVTRRALAISWVFAPVLFICLPGCPGDGDRDLLMSRVSRAADDLEHHIPEIRLRAWGDLSEYGRLGVPPLVRFLRKGGSGQARLHAMFILRDAHDPRAVRVLAEIADMVPEARMNWAAYSSYSGAHQAIVAREALAHILETRFREDPDAGIATSGPSLFFDEIVAYHERIRAWHETWRTTYSPEDWPEPRS